MSITHIDGNIFTSAQPAIGHGVNNEGAMGSGIAKTVRELYPSVYNEYHKYCKTVGMKGGDHLPLKALEYDGPGDRWILNIASQEQQGANGNYVFLESALEKAFRWVEDNHLSGLALPKIGAGIAMLRWNDVLAIIEHRASHYPHLEVEIWNFVDTKK